MGRCLTYTVSNQDIECEQKEEGHIQLIPVTTDHTHTLSLHLEPLRPFLSDKASV